MWISICQIDVTGSDRNYIGSEPALALVSGPGDFSTFRTMVLQERSGIYNVGGTYETNILKERKRVIDKLNQPSQETRSEDQERNQKGYP